MDAMQARLREILEEFWGSNVLEVVSATGGEDEEFPVDHPLVQLDSITAVGVLMEVEKVVGKELPIEKIVRKGGYSTKEEFVEDVTKAVSDFLEAP